MAFRTSLAALALALAPGFALAQGCNYDKATQTTSQCQVGQTWDAASQTCVAPVNS